MNIQPVRHDNIAEAADAKIRPAKQKSGGENAIGRDTIAPATKGKLLEILKQQADVRPEVVERGRQLLNDPTYPSRDMFGEIAKRLMLGI